METRNIAIDKTILRKKIRYKLRDVSFATSRKELSSKFCDLLSRHPLFTTHHRIGLYMPMVDEVDITSLLNEYIQDKELMLPKVLTSNDMVFVPLSSLSNLKCNAMGIKEPISELPIINIKQPSLLIVPALAYDKNRYRLGRGGGYYDRYIATYKPYTLGISLHPLLDSIPHDKWDIPMDEVLTLPY